MKCIKKRFSKEKYCRQDFFFQVKLFKKTTLQPASALQIDATEGIEQTINIMCHVEKKGVDFESGGELVRNKTILDITCLYIDTMSDIQRNTQRWYVEFEGERFKVVNADPASLIRQYFYITAERVAN